ncbi:hypothetical protein [Saccharopolyspora sp. NPDC002376]
MLDQAGSLAKEFGAAGAVLPERCGVAHRQEQLRGVRAVLGSAQLEML